MTKKIQGQSLMEVVLAIGVISLILVAIVSLTTGSVRNSTFSRDNAAAIHYSEEAMEWLRGQRDAGWQQFYANVAFSTNWCLADLNWAISTSCGTTPITNTPFVRDLLFSNRNLNTTNARVTVSWSDANGAHSVVSETILTQGGVLQ